jgi:hypothetical protein
MSQCTPEEKQETIDALKGPRYFRIIINGYGGEAAYMSISKEAHDFWKEATEDNGDNDLVQYMISDNDEEVEYDEIADVPENAKFMHDPDNDNYKRSWYESHTEYEHSYGASYESAYVTVDEVDSTDYSANTLNEIMSQESVSELCNRISEETDYTVDICESEECYADLDVKYAAQLYSSEKGCFFDGIVETIGEFDPKKLMFHLSEFDNGEETITLIEYDGKEVENNGGDTNGKGYYASVWEN